jgi:hypothetical protein
VAGALDGALSKSAAGAWDARVTELVKAGVPDAQPPNGHLCTKAAPDIALCDRAGKRWLGRDLFRDRGILPARPRYNAVPNIVVSDYFDRLAPTARSIDRRYERRLTPRWSVTVMPVPAPWKNGSGRGRSRRIRSAILKSSVRA